MKQFEYKVLHITRAGIIIGGTSDKEWEEIMNNLGKEGWELVGFTGIGGVSVIDCIFKRQLGTDVGVSWDGLK